MYDPKTLSQVVEVLTAMAKLPPRRGTPQPGDLKGDFDYWFDGGAIKIITGWTTYCFADGSSASVGTGPALSVQIDTAEKESFWLAPAQSSLSPGPESGAGAPLPALTAVADVRRGLDYLLGALDENGTVLGYRGWIVMKHAEIIGRELRERDG